MPVILDSTSNQYPIEENVTLKAESIMLGEESEIKIEGKRKIKG